LQRQASQRVGEEAVVVLDGLVSDTQREQLLHHMLGDAPRGTAPPDDGRCDAGIL